MQVGAKRAVLAVEVKIHKLPKRVMGKLKCEVCRQPAYRTYWVVTGEGAGRDARFHIECLKHYQDRKEWERSEPRP